MSEPQEEIARAAAARLSGAMDPRLPQWTEHVLNKGGTSERAKRYFDASLALGLASFLVSVAALAWTMWRDSRQKGAPLAPEVLSRRIRVQLAESNEAPHTVSDEDRDRVVEVVVEETISYGRSHQ